MMKQIMDEYTQRAEDIAVELYWKGKDPADIARIDYIQKIRIDQAIKFGFRRAMLYKRCYQ